MVAVVGVGAVVRRHLTLDVRRPSTPCARCRSPTVDRRSVNREVVLGSRRAGAGIFIRSLQRRRRGRRLDVPLVEHDIVAEMRDERRRLLDRALT